jgi:hypothetical protein
MTFVDASPDRRTLFCAFQPTTQRRSEMTKKLKVNEAEDVLAPRNEEPPPLVVEDARHGEMHEVRAFIPVMWGDDTEPQKYCHAETATPKQIQRFIDRLQAEIDKYEDEIAGLNVLYMRAAKREDAEE